MIRKTVTQVKSNSLACSMISSRQTNKNKMDLTTNGIVITDDITFVQTNKEKLMSAKEDNKES